MHECWCKNHWIRDKYISYSEYWWRRLHSWYCTGPHCGGALTRGCEVPEVRSAAASSPASRCSSSVPLGVYRRSRCGAGTHYHPEGRRRKNGHKSTVVCNMSGVVFGFYTFSPIFSSRVASALVLVHSVSPFQNQTKKKSQPLKSLNKTLQHGEEGSCDWPPPVCHMV